MVKTVLTTLPIYSFMTLDPPLLMIKAIDKWQRAFLWKGIESVSGRHCLIAWPSVCKPTHFGGLGLHNLRVLDHALRIRWLWVQSSWIARPWHALTAQASKAERDLFQVSLVVRLENGEHALFWSDRWINGQSIPAIPPSLITTMPLAIRNKRMVTEALLNGRWIAYITGGLDV